MVQGLRYFLYGDGRWLNCWEATGHDVWLMLAMISVLLWLVIEYVRYSALSRAAMLVNPGSQHCRSEHMLSKAVLASAIVHVLSIGIIWFTTPYYIIAVFAALHALHVHRLVSAKMVYVVAEEHAKARKAVIELSDQNLLLTQKNHGLSSEVMSLREQLAEHIARLEGTHP